MAATDDQRMLNSDAFAWYMEKDPVLRSTVVAIIVLDRSPSWDRLRARVDRLTRVVPTLRMTVQAPPVGGVAAPRWVLADRFDLDFHMRRARLPEGGGMHDVLEFARTAAMHDFDRARPLWEFTLLDGMADGGAALVVKVHHALTDGIGGMQLAALTVDEGPEASELGPMPAEPRGASLSSLEVARRELADAAVWLASTTGLAVRGLPGAVFQAGRRPASVAQGIVATGASVARMVAPVSRQSSAVFGRRRTGRSLATLDVPLEALRTAAGAVGAHINDAYLAALTAGVQRYHEKHGAPLTQLRATVPVSVRTERDGVAGNRITLVRITLPVTATATPEQRIDAIATVMRRWRHEPALAYTQQIAFGLNLMPRPYLTGIFKRIEMVASDVPGLLDPVWLAGARVRAYYPFGPTIGAAFNATLVSYAGTCNVGINIDTGAVEDPDTMVECLRDGFADIAGPTAVVAD